MNNELLRSYLDIKNLAYKRVEFFNEIYTFVGRLVEKYFESVSADRQELEQQMALDFNYSEFPATRIGIDFICCFASEVSIKTLEDKLISFLSLFVNEKEKLVNQCWIISVVLRALARMRSTKIKDVLQLLLDNNLPTKDQNLESVLAKGLFAAICIMPDIAAKWLRIVIEQEMGAKNSFGSVQANKLVYLITEDVISELGTTGSQKDVEFLLGYVRSINSESERTFIRTVVNNLRKKCSEYTQKRIFAYHRRNYELLDSVLRQFP